MLPFDIFFPCAIANHTLFLNSSISITKFERPFQIISLFSPEPFRFSIKNFKIFISIVRMRLEKGDSNLKVSNPWSLLFELIL